MSTVAADTKEYARLLTRTLSAPIESEADYERLLAERSERNILFSIGNSVE